LLARAPDLLCRRGWGLLFHTSASTIVSYIVKLALVACLALGALLLLLLSISTAIDVYRRRRRQKSDNVWKLTSFRRLNFDVEDVLKNMDGLDLIGVGGSGKVHRIQLRHRDRQYRILAVKELTRKTRNQQAEDQMIHLFDAEVKVLGSIRHRNIITLLCCITVSICTNLLVYEYMENGSLDQWLHKPRGRLDWPSRVGIATDAARGLSYMHDQAIIHRDVKSSNILLDRDFEAKIGDFGLARVLAKPGESEPASAIMGTPGHIAPEYLRDAEVSEKVDVYSFGVVLLELVTGKQPHDAGTKPGVGLAKWASQQHRNRIRWDHIIDKDIQNPAYEDDMKAVFMLGLRCTSEDPLNRPAMNKVLEQLEQLLSCDPSRVKVKHRGSFLAKVYRKIQDKIFRQGQSAVSIQ